jgi:hypothetical protein
MRVKKREPVDTASTCYEYPLRPDYLAQLVLPREITVIEAARLCDFIRTLVIEPSTAEASAQRQGDAK